MIQFFDREPKRAGSPRPCFSSGHVGVGGWRRSVYPMIYSAVLTRCLRSTSAVTGNDDSD
jgi:hypothetical protein